MTPMPTAFRTLIVAVCALAACAESPPAADAHLDAVAREHSGHTPGPNASFAEPQEVLADKMSYRYGNGGLAHGYLARPTTFLAAHLKAAGR